jgi:hypothetical protein
MRHRILGGAGLPESLAGPPAGLGRGHTVAPGVVRSSLRVPVTQARREHPYRGTAAPIPAGRPGEAGDIAPACTASPTHSPPGRS